MPSSRQARNHFGIFDRFEMNIRNLITWRYSMTTGHALTFLFVSTWFSKSGTYVHGSLEYSLPPYVFLVGLSGPMPFPLLLISILILTQKLPDKLTAPLFRSEILLDL